MVVELSLVAITVAKRYTLWRANGYQRILPSEISHPMCIDDPSKPENEVHILGFEIM